MQKSDGMLSHADLLNWDEIVLVYKFLRGSVAFVNSGENERALYNSKSS